MEARIEAHIEARNEGLLNFLKHWIHFPKYLKISWLNFFSPAIDYFSPSETCFLQILARCMYGATLEQIGICHLTVWSVVVQTVFQQLLINVSCVSVHARCIAWHKPGAYILRFSFFEIRGRNVQSCLSRSGLSNYIIMGWTPGFSKPPETATILQLAVTRQCTNCRLCVWLYTVSTANQHVQSHLPGISLWFRCSWCWRRSRGWWRACQVRGFIVRFWRPTVTIFIKIIKGQGTDWKGHGGGFGFRSWWPTNTSISDGQGTGSGYINVLLSFSSLISSKQINSNSSRTWNCYLSRDCTDILERFTPIIFITSREAVVDAKTYSRHCRQGLKQVL